MKLYKYEVALIEGDRDSDLDFPYTNRVQRFFIGVDEDFMTEEDVCRAIREKHATMWYTRTKIVNKEEIKICD